MELSTISEIIGLTSDICVLILTVYTLYVTAFSKKMSYVSMGHTMSAFFGETIHLYVKNNSLHSMPITKVFLLKRMGGMFHRIAFADYNQPLIIDAWHIGKIETEPFTQIEGFGEPDDEFGDDNEDNDLNKKAENSISDIYKDAVFGLVSGDKVIWIKPYKKAPLRAAKAAYKKYDYDTLCVTRKNYGDKTLSNTVKYIIKVLTRDINNHKAVETVFVNIGEDALLLSDSILGCNALDKEWGTSAEELEKRICEHFEIEEKNISVRQI